MTRRTWVARVVCVAAVGVVSAFVVSAVAAHDDRGGVRNIVLVHGAWADGSSWAKVIPLLRHRGLNVVAVQEPLTSFANDVAAVQRAISLADGPVLLVGHSYGGSVITEAGNDPKVVGLMYVSAFAPEQNQSTFQLATDPQYATPGGAELVLDDFGYLTLTRKGIKQDFAQDLSEIEKEVLFAAQGPWSTASAFGTITSPAWRTKKTWFVVASNDRMVSPVLERLEADRMHAVTLTLPTSHVAMLADPFDVAAFILRAAANPDRE
jgi:pimeloyl-ACP methyl ester carboxylesterase